MTTAAVEKVGSTVIAALNNGSISWDELVKALAPESTANGSAEVRALSPITDEQRVAIDTLTDKYGKVAPTERRTLASGELRDLSDERAVLKSVEQLVKDRANDIRNYILNHADILCEQEGLSKTAATDKGGHYAAARRIPIDGTDIDWAVEPREGAATLDVAALKMLADSDEVPEFTHDDYIAMTTQTRVFDEDKALAMLAKRPELVDVVQRATTRAVPSVAVTTRKKKKS